MPHIAFVLKKTDKSDRAELKRLDNRNEISD